MPSPLHPNVRGRRYHATPQLLLAASCLIGFFPSDARGQLRRQRFGTTVPNAVRAMYDSGLDYLVKSQQADGSWNSSYGNGPGITGLCCLAILSSGEDPNFGKYAPSLHKGLRYILQSQNARTGFLAKGAGNHGSMYEHGFATLTLAEAYGAVDDVALWRGADGGASGESQPTLGLALERAVGCIITSQNNNPFYAWRYQPRARDADTSVSGAMMVALLAARNAGIKVPEKNIKLGLDYFKKATMTDGSVMYVLGSGGGESLARSSISCLVFAIAKLKDSREHKSTLQYLRDRVETIPSMHKYYTRYYMAQALFQGDIDTWEKWNEFNTESLKEEQNQDGRIGPDAYSTSMSLLSMALNFRFLPIYER
jgi:hypothetical protein